MEANEKKKKAKNIETVEDIKNSAAKQSSKITANKILNKYKAMRRPKKPYLANEEDLETIDYNELQEDLCKRESILETANKVFDFERFKKEQAEALKEITNKNSTAKQSTKITAKKILNKYKAMKRPKKPYLVNEEDLETTDYNELQEDLFKGESILAAADRVFDFNKFKKQQEDAIKISMTTF